MIELVGRAAERERLERLLHDAVEGQGRALALVGEPGIGKSALLEHARARAGGAFRVLSATGAEAEADLPFAALLSLLRPVLDRMGELPPVQAGALAGALAVGPPARADRLVVHAGALGLLSAAAAERPLLVVVDDAHWLDDASADALLFAARRLAGERVALLLALRPAEGRGLDLAGVERMEIGGLERAAATELLRRAAGEALRADVVDRLLGATEGNPLALLEAPLNVPGEQLSGRDPLGDPLPVGPGIQAGFRRRLERLPRRTRTALLLLAAAGAEPFPESTELGVTLADLEPAEADNLVEVTAGEVRFRHPLARAAAYQDAPAPERRAAHRALAEHTTGVRRAGHLWAAAAKPDPAVAAALDEAAAEARARTGFSAAALAMERAARLTAPGDERAGRLFAAAQDRLVGGDAARAGELAREALPEATSIPLRAELNGLVGALAMLSGSLDEGFQAAAAAADSIARENPERAAWMLATAGLACHMAGRLPVGYETTVRAYELALRAGGETAPIIGIQLGTARLMTGRDPGELIDLWPETLDERILVPGSPHLIGALQLLGWIARYDEADTFAARADEMIAAAGAVGALTLLRGGQSEIEMRRGDWVLARARISEALRLADDTGQALQRAIPLTMLGRLDAALGLEEECRASVREELGFAQSAGAHSLNVHAEATLGLLELGVGRVSRAAQHLDAAARLAEECGLRDPAVVPFPPDRVEALLRAAEPERAEAALAELEAAAEQTGRPWVRAVAARCRGMLEHDFDAWFERAYAAHGPSESPFELGRTELCHGERLRRVRRVSEARERLRSALARFEGLGAAPWADRARRELRAAGGAASPARMPPMRELTPQELEIALAVARGATNREVATALYVSPKTIEVHLTRVFRKLGVRSRTELATLIAATK
jgi:DNA-binding CsgD family transcriptional regulator